MQNKMKIQFPALSQNEMLSRMVVSGFLAQLNPTVEDISDIKTAVSEAVTNAIVHGYKDKSGSVILEGRIYKDRIVYISIKDRGCGIEDVEKAREPLFTTGADEERAGLGFSIMESFMDKLSVKSATGKGTTVTMVKRLKEKG
ncbi:MAG: anti-sigma F factor [Oscillospiraceae bacterium]|nr:anti-sigma F factor [Oscillospiraceae bacterium]MBQ8883960.1 anti-sigma F factor [Oscillospiraceae bacterium]